MSDNSDNNECVRHELTWYMWYCNVEKTALLKSEMIYVKVSHNPNQ